MMWRVAWRSLINTPGSGGRARRRIRIRHRGEWWKLLGVGQVILEQSHAPALAGGGYLVLSGPFGPVPSARHAISTLRQTIGSGCSCGWSFRDPHAKLF